MAKHLSYRGCKLLGRHAVVGEIPLKLITQLRRRSNRQQNWFENQATTNTKPLVQRASAATYREAVDNEIQVDRVELPALLLGAQARGERKKLPPNRLGDSILNVEKETAKVSTNNTTG